MLFAVNAAAQTTKSGIITGTSINWTYNTGTNTLTLSGSGALPDYNSWTVKKHYFRTNENALIGKDCIMDVVENINIESGINTIGTRYFYNAPNLKKLELSESVTVIKDKAFEMCTSLSEIYGSINNDIEVASSAFEGCQFIEENDGILVMGNTLVAAYSEFELVEIIVPENVTKIKSEAFINYQTLQTITFKGNLTSIGDEAFSGCTNLETLNIPNTVTTWGKDIFTNCTSLPNDGTYQKAGDHVIVKVSKTGEKQYRIPNNIIYIAEDAFSACDKVTKIVSEHTTTIPQAAKTAFTFTQIETPNIYVEDGKESECANKWGIAATKINHTTIPVGNTGYATVSLEHSAQIPSGVKAYTVYVEDGQIKLKQVSKLAKHAGYMLYGDVKNHTFTPLGNNYSETEDNHLVGLQEDEELSGADKYLLTSRNGDVKFRCLDKTSKVLTAGKAYLYVPNATASEYSVRIISDDDTETDIDETLENNAHANNRTIYNIAGQRVNQPRQGLNIIDGKLVIM